MILIGLGDLLHILKVWVGNSRNNRLVDEAVCHSVISCAALIVGVLFDVAFESSFCGHSMSADDCLCVGLHTCFNRVSSVTSPSIRRVVFVLKVFRIAPILLRGLILIDYLHRALLLEKRAL